jgi:ATP-dependent Lon protease
LQEQGVELPDTLDSQLTQIDDPSALADIVAQTLVRDISHRQEVMEELRVADRLRLLIRHLKAQAS